MAWVVGLIVPILLPSSSVNQRLPSGPDVIPIGVGVGGRDGELGDGVGGLIDHPDPVAPGLGEPEVAVGSNRDGLGQGIGGLGGVLGDGRQQSPRLQRLDDGPPAPHRPPAGRHVTRPPSSRILLGADPSLVLSVLMEGAGRLAAAHPRIWATIRDKLGH